MNEIMVGVYLGNACRTKLDPIGSKTAALENKSFHFIPTQFIFVSPRNWFRESHISPRLITQ